MTGAHALLIGVNLLLASIIYVSAASSRRLDGLHLAIIGSFVSIAVVDLALTLTDHDGSAGFVVIAILDVALIALVCAFVLRERRARLHLEQRRVEAEDALPAEREARALAMQDRLGGQF